VNASAPASPSGVPKVWRNIRDYLLDIDPPDIKINNAGQGERTVPPSGGLALKKTHIQSKIRIQMSGIAAAVFFVVAFASNASGVTILAASSNLNLNGNGADLTNYAFAALGPYTVEWNSGPVAGNTLFGQGETVNLSGGNNGGLTNGGKLYKDSSVIVNGSLQNPITQTSISEVQTRTDLNEAVAIATYARNLAADATITGNTITGVGGGNLTVVNAGSLQNIPLTITGTAGDYFVINVDSLQTNAAMTLGGGVTASHILWNFTGNATGNVFQTSGGDTVYGTFLSALGSGSYDFSNLNLTGELINTTGIVQLVSGSSISTQASFQVLTATPEPASFVLFGAGLLILRLVKRTNAHSVHFRVVQGYSRNQPQSNRCNRLES
jgi:hypothetical protein